MKSLVKFIHNIFTHEIYWKIISVLIAIIMWFVVMNLINPTETKTFSTTVNLLSTEEFAEQGYTVLNYDDIKNIKVDIKIKGTRPALDDLKSNSTISSVTAEADLSGIKLNSESAFPQNYTLKVSPKVIENYVYSYEIVSYTPSFINVEIDKISKGTRNLSVTTTGKAASGYIAEEPECDVDKVTISGPASLVNNVAKVQATIDISGKTSLTEQSVEVFALDSQDEIIKEFKVDPQYVKIKVNVRKQGFLKINEPITIGQLPEGLKLESIDWYPKTIDVTGKSSALETMSLLKLPVIDLNGISSSVSYNYSVNKLLDGTDLTSDTDNIVVTVNVVPADDGADIIPLTIAPNDITILSLPQDTNCTIDSVDIELQGDLKTIEALTPQELNPIINLTGFDVGSHSITVNLTLPEGITAAKNTANITISEGSSETLTETTTAEETTETEKETEDESQSEADVIDEDSEKE